jgi:hypothetical protein
MIYFNVKDKSRKKINKDKTLDSIHNTTLTQLQSLKNNIPQLQKELDSYTNKYNKLLKKKFSNYNNEELKNYYVYKNKISQLQQDINNINNKNVENDYFLNTGDIIFNYYSQNTLSNNDNNYKNHNNNDTGILSFFNKNYNNKNLPSNYYNESESESDEDIHSNKTYNKAEMLKQYLTITDPNYKGNINFINKNVCNICNQNLVINLVEGISICSHCGELTHILIDTERPSYKEPPAEYNYFNYKRMDHFNEWLAQFQSKESTEIPQDVIDKIIIELKKQRINNIAKLDSKKIRDILKKLKLNKYYEHISYIKYKINGIPPPIIEPQLENKLRSMFREIQNPFLKHCPKNRNNFLSYSYCLHKFFELLGYEEYKNLFTLLKSREKLFEQDQIWKNICKELNWTFHKSL